MKHIQLFEGFLNESKSIKVNQKFGRWKIEKYEPLRFGDFGEAFGGNITLVDTITMGEIRSLERVYISRQYDGKWFASFMGVQIEDSSPQKVIKKILQKESSKK